MAQERKNHTMPSMNKRRKSAALAVQAVLAGLLLAAATAPAQAQKGTPPSQAQAQLEQQALDSAAMAAPLLDKIDAGGSVTDQEVKDARIGLLEPIMLVKAAYRRETDAIEVRYVQEVMALKPQLMLSTAYLASPALRSQTRSQLGPWKQAIAAHKVQMEAANARGLRGIKATEPLFPASVYQPIARGFGRAVRLNGDFVASLVASETAVVAGVAALLDLLDATNPQDYVFEQDPAPRLLFRDQATLNRYNQLLNSVKSASQESAKAKARLSQALVTPDARPGAPSRP